MSSTQKITEPEHVISCAACLREVPISEATVPEATDYFIHFCGLECYEKWQNRTHTVNADKDSANTNG